MNTLVVWIIICRIWEISGLKPYQLKRFWLWFYSVNSKILLILIQTNGEQMSSTFDNGGFRYRSTHPTLHCH